MKTYLWAAACVIVIILIVVLSRSHKTAAPAADASLPAASASTSTDPSMGAMPMQPAASITTPDGLQYAIVKQGSGAAAASGDTVTVNYTGTLADGTEFDSNVDPKFGHVSPFSFQLGANTVIPGWEEGVMGMKVGEERTLVIPPALAYGAQGSGSAVPPNATLTFDVTVTGISHS